MKRALFLSIISLACFASSLAADRLTVSDVKVKEGKEASIDIGCELQTACKAYQMDVELGSGYTLKLDAAGNPVTKCLTSTDHEVYSRRVSDGKYRFVVVSMKGQQLPKSGSLLRMTVTAPSSAKAGSSITGRVRAIEFTTAQTTPLRLSDTSFKVTVVGQPPKGDVNDDSAINVADIATVIDVMAGSADVSSALADVNGDGSVNVADIAAIIDIMAGGGGTEPGGDDTPSYTSCPDNNHPHLIDLGLPSGTKWACCNVGASKPEEYGDYFAWGETKPKDVYNWQTYIHCDGSKDTCHDLGSDIADTKYDAATANWKEPWRIPTWEQCKELIDNCTSEWTTQNGVSGRKFTGSNGGTVFLPAAGRRWYSDLNNAGSSGKYWLSMPYHKDCAYVLFSSSDGVSWQANNFRANGFTVRPVR